MTRSVRVFLCLVVEGNMAQAGDSILDRIRPVGRPSLYTEDLAAKICELMMAGQTLNAIVKMDGMPGRTTVLRWLDADENFRAAYDRARDIQADVWVEQGITIADNNTRDEIEIIDEDGVKRRVIDHDHIKRSMLRITTRQWVAGKFARGRYGDKQVLEHTGKDGGPIQYEDTRERNLAAINTLSTRLARAAPGAPPAPSAGEDSEEDDD